MRKHTITLNTSQRQKIKKLLKRKLISHLARQQLQALLLYDDKKNSVIAIAQIVGVSTQRLKKWVGDFIEDELDSLLVYKEKADERKKGKSFIVLKNFEINEKTNTSSDQDNEETIDQSGTKD